MKALSILLLFVSVTAATFSQWLVLGSFHFNQTYIAKNLCVNRNNKNSHCAGKCYLGKQISQQEKAPVSNTAGKIKIEVQLFLVVDKSETSAQNTSSSSYNLFQNHVSLQLFATSIFRPPAV